MALPDELVEAVAYRKAALFLGAGFSQAQDGPSWTVLLENAVKWAFSQGMLREEPRDELLRLIHNGGQGRLVAGSYLRTHLKANLDDYIDETLGKLRPHAFSKTLASLDWSCVITTNFDCLFEHSVASDRTLRRPLSLDVGSIKDRSVRQQIYSEDPILLKLHGSVLCPDLATAPGRVVLDRDGVQRIKADPAVKITMLNLLEQYTFLFLGYGFGDEALPSQMGVLSDTFQGDARNHYVLTNKDSPIWDDHLRTSLKLEPIFIRSSGYEELYATFATELSDAVQNRRASATYRALVIFERPNAAFRQVLVTHDVPHWPGVYMLPNFSLPPNTSARQRENLLREWLNSHFSIGPDDITRITEYESSREQKPNLSSGADDQQYNYFPYLVELKPAARARMENQEGLVDRSNRKYEWRDPADILNSSPESRESNSGPLGLASDILARDVSITWVAGMG